MEHHQSLFVLHANPSTARYGVRRNAAASHFAIAEMSITGVRAPSAPSAPNAPNTFARSAAVAGCDPCTSLKTKYVDRPTRFVAGVFQWL